MSSEPPPNPQVSTFNPAFWNITADSGITTQFLDANYLKFPFSQSAVETFVVSPQCSATQPAPTDSSNKIPTTAWVQSAIGTGSVPNLQGVLNLGNTATGASATIGLTNSGVGGSANPQLTLNNSNAGVGASVGVPSVEYYKSGRSGATADIIATQSFNAKNASGVKTEYGRVEASIRGVGAGNDDGSLGFYFATNGTLAEVFRMNGADNENNTFRPIDMNGQDLKSSSGNMGISTASSTGTGTITLTPKTGAVVDIAGNATLSGTRQIAFGGGTNITDIINQTGLTITNNTTAPDITQSIYQDANCNLVQTQTSTNSMYFNTSTPQTQTIRRMDLTSGSDLQKNQSTLVQQRLDYIDIATGDQSSIRLENHLASLNNVIGQNYTTGAGAVLETTLQTTPYGAHRLLMTNNNTGFSTTLNTIQLNINDTTNNKSITINNNPSSTECRMDLFKNDGGGINSQSGLVNNTGTQTLFLNHTDNANYKTISVENQRGGAGSITYNNLIDTNGFSVNSNQAITMSGADTANVSAGASVNLVSAGANINMYASAGGVLMDTTSLTFTGASLQSNSSSGNSGEHLVITLNGTQYKIALQNP